MVSGFIVKTAVVLGAAALGIEYGRRHPESPWSDLGKAIKAKFDKARDKGKEVLDQRRAAKGRAAAEEIPLQAVPADASAVPEADGDFQWPPQDASTAPSDKVDDPPAPPVEHSDPTLFPEDVAESRGGGL